MVSAAADAARSDFVIYDTGPNMGPLNKSVLLDSNYLIIPAACDLFSLRAIKSLGHAITSWLRDAALIRDVAPDNVPLLPGRPALLGYVLQRLRVYGGQLSKPQAKYLPLLERRIQEEMRSITKSVGSTARKRSSLRLGYVGDLEDLVVESLTKGIPVWEVPGGKSALRESARTQFSAIAEQVLHRTHR